jgi:hypothetical protein
MRLASRLSQFHPEIWIDRFRSYRIRVKALATSTQFILERSVFLYLAQGTMILLRYLARPARQVSRC